MKRMMKAIKANPLFLAFLLPMVTDGVVTLVGQDSSYWQGYHKVNEGGPAYFLLATNPLVYVGGSLLYMALCCWLVYRLKYPLNLMLAVALTVGHSWGSSTRLRPWLDLWLGQAGFLSTRSMILLEWTLLVGYFALVGVCAGISFALYMHVYQEKVERRQRKSIDGIAATGSHPVEQQLE